MALISPDFHSGETARRMLSICVSWPASLGARPFLTRFSERAGNPAAGGRRAASRGSAPRSRRGLRPSSRMASAYSTSRPSAPEPVRSRCSAVELVRFGRQAGVGIAGGPLAAQRDKDGAVVAVGEHAIKERLELTGARLRVCGSCSEPAMRATYSSAVICTGRAGPSPSIITCSGIT